MARSIDQIKQAEHDRLAFVEDRDGVDAMIEFARLVYGLYRECLRGKKTGKPSPYGKAYREELLISCVVFRRVLRSK